MIRRRSRERKKVESPVIMLLNMRMARKVRNIMFRNFCESTGPKSGTV
jgi:hypothetical protein